MTEPLHNLGHAFRPRPVGQLGPREHDNGKAEFARGVDLGTRARSPGIAGNDPFDVARAHHLQFTGKREWSTRYDDIGIRKRQRPIGRIDKPQSVDVLQLGAEGCDVLPADRKKHPRAILWQRRDSGGDTRDLDPIVAGRFYPGRALERDKRRSGCLARRNRVAAHLGREGMGRVDDMRDSFSTNVFGKAVRAAEAADAGRQRLVRRGAGAPPVGIDRVEPRTRRSVREQIGIARSAQNEGACHG